MSTPDGLPAPDSFGRYLRQERELRSMSLEQIAEQTRIGVGNLRALELDDAARLPARVFLVGYVRAYAQAIGLDPDDTVLRFEEHWQAQALPSGAEASGRSRWLRLALGAGAAALASGVAYLLARG